MDTYFDLVETLKKYTYGMNYFSSVVSDNERNTPTRKL